MHKREMRVFCDIYFDNLGWMKNVDFINNMESFSGKAAKEAKGCFNELHLTILESFRGLFDDLDENLKQHL